MFNFKRNQIIITVLVFMIAIAAYLNTQETDSGVPMNYAQEEDDFFAGYDDTQNNAVGTQGEANNQAVESTSVVENTPALDSQQTTNTGEELIIDPLATPGSEVAANVQDINSEELNQTFDAIITKKQGGEAVVSNEVTEVSKNLDVSYFAEEKLLREQSRASQVEQLTQYVANENLDKDTKAKAAENLLQIQERIEKESSAEALLRAKGFKEVYVRIDDDSVDVVVSKAELTDSDIAQIEEIVNRKTGYSVGKIKITPLNGIIKQNQN